MTQIYALKVPGERSPKGVFRAKIKGLAGQALVRAPGGESIPSALASSRDRPHSLPHGPTTPVSGSMPAFPSPLSPPAASDTERCDDSGPPSHPGAPPHLKTVHFITRASLFDPGNELTSSGKARHQDLADHRQDARSRIQQNFFPGVKERVVGPFAVSRPGLATLILQMALPQIADPQPLPFLAPEEATASSAPKITGGM